MKRIALTLTCFIFCLPGFSQTISKRLILTDSKESYLINSSQKCFDKEGNYCFKIKQDGKEYFVTNKDKVGGVKFIGSMFSTGGDISYTNSYSDAEDKPWYYKNSRGVKVLGPVTGKLENYITTGTREHVAIVTRYGDSLYHYVNGNLVARNLRAAINKSYSSDYDWCAFSENGNSIYCVRKDSSYCLFVNGKLIDKSSESFTGLHINDNGDYIYAEGRMPAVKTKGYDYMYFIHTKDTVLGPVRTVWESALTDNGAYYYSGDDNGPEYIVVNNILQKGIEKVSKVMLPDRRNYLYQFSRDKEQHINVNGKAYSCPSILQPGINKKGDFSFYGIIDYYLYKFINGKRVEQPVTNYGVRARPLYISPEGESTHYFETDDSIYLYQDENLLFQPISKHTNFVVQPYKEFLRNLYGNDKSSNFNSLFYMEYGSNAFWVFNGLFSKPMLPAKPHSYADDINGEIVAGELNENGFFSIQKISKKFVINVNNKVYTEVTDVDDIFQGTCFFDGRELVFYGVKGLSIYQFKLSL